MLGETGEVAGRETHLQTRRGVKGVPTCPGPPHHADSAEIRHYGCGGRVGRRPRSLPHSPRSAGSNLWAGGLWKGRGAHFPTGPGPRSPGAQRGQRGRRPPRSRRPASAQAAPPPKGVPPGPGQRGPRARQPHARRPQGPALTGGGSERGGAAAGTVPRRAPGRTAQGAAREAPDWGEVAAPPPPQHGPTRPPEEGGSGRLSGSASVEAGEDSGEDLLSLRDATPGHLLPGGESLENHRRQERRRRWRRQQRRPALPTSPPPS